MDGNHLPLKTQGFNTSCENVCTFETALSAKKAYCCALACPDEKRRNANSPSLNVGKKQQIVLLKVLLKSQMLLIFCL